MIRPATALRGSLSGSSLQRAVGEDGYAECSSVALTEDAEAFRSDGLPARFSLSTASKCGQAYRRAAVVLEPIAGSQRDGLAGAAESGERIQRRSRRASRPHGTQVDADRDSIARAGDPGRARRYDGERRRSYWVPSGRRNVEEDAVTDPGRYHLSEMLGLRKWAARSTMT
jgi:hypothetical protein